MPRHPRRPLPPPPAPGRRPRRALGASACGGTDPVDQETFQSELLERTNPEDGPVVPEAVAACLTDKIFEEFDQEEVDRIYRAATQTELDEDVGAQLSDFNGECFEAEGPPEGGTTTTVESTETTEAPATTDGGDGG